MTSAATISPCGKYRSWLSRGDDDTVGTMVFIMLNPSTADAEQDDPTIRRCLGFMRRERLTGLVVVNLFTGRATKPVDLWRLDDPVGPDADDALDRALKSVENPETLKQFFPDRAPGHVVCAWSAVPSGAPEWFREMHRDRVETVLDRAFKKDRPIWALGLTDAGAPRHPLYLRGDAPLIPFIRGHS